MGNPKGVDLSHFQQTVDFGEIVAAGITFVYLKATQGLSYVDPTFEGRRGMAHDSGTRLGPYHFMDPLADGGDQALHLVDTIGALQLSELPVAVDCENTPGWDQIDQPTRVLRLGHLLGGIEDGTGIRPMIYTSMEWWLEFFGNADFTGHPLWVAHWSDQPGNLGLWKAWTAWQYGQYGTVAGAGAGSVDTDQWNGDLPAVVAP